MESPSACLYEQLAIDTTQLQSSSSLERIVAGVATNGLFDLALHAVVFHHVMQCFFESTHFCVEVAARGRTGDIGTPVVHIGFDMMKPLVHFVEVPNDVVVAVRAAVVVFFHQTLNVNCRLSNLVHFAIDRFVILVVIVMAIHLPADDIRLLIKVRRQPGNVRLLAEHVRFESPLRP